MRTGSRRASPFASIVVLPILLFSAVVACKADLQLATAALQKKDPAKALALLEPFRSSCVQSSAFYELLGLANELSGNSTAAEEALRMSVAFDAKSTRVLTELGATYLRNGKPRNAEKVLEQALVLDPSNIVTVKYAIGAAVQSHDWERAGELFHQIGAEHNMSELQKDPILVLWFAEMLIATKQNDRIDSVLSPQRSEMPPTLLFSLGTLFAQHRMYQLAVDYLKEVPDQNADDALYFNLGLSYSHLHRFDEARKCYFRAIDQRSAHADAYFHVGLDYTSSGQPRMGIPWLFHAHVLDPARPDITYALLEQLIALEYFDTATEVLQQGLNNGGQDPMLVVAAGDLKRAQGDSAAALENYRKALAERPALVPALVGAAKANISTGNEAEAKKFLQEALSQDPDDPPANAELGRLEARDGDSKAALQHLQHAWVQNQADTDVALEIARVYIREKQPISALRLLTSINSVMRQSPEFHFELARVYSLLGRPEDARLERDAFTSLQASARNDLRFQNPRTYVF